ncbi:hypothetical protein HYH03_008868 [Edaphochlamys debaryana]|uniref:Histone-lysine N-methyltransferase NSD-like PHD zinc finger domain-containing protein n=1 Tax=Edaphochlamys debaryana TaxID=47281 RepID=A0A835XZ90_9CHLO|nr:hypothetical protein HYH03_008868 [Edaphochlamys debaryana]|eukprot:KAG2492961.1 hypothetical protein HYH03_008868 [Edaphochlamys debaryana]
MASLGVCQLCQKEVTEDDYRREVDCPSPACPGRMYHEDCIAGYLKKTKYSQDRRTGFPCPVAISESRLCPGYCVKMHNYIPCNKKKKQARMEALAAAAPLPPKPKPPAVKKAAQTVAAAAIVKGAALPTPQPAAVRHKPTPVVGASVGVSVAAKLQGYDGQARFIPGLGDISNKEALRAQVAQLRAEAKAGGKGEAKAGKQLVVAAAPVKSVAPRQTRPDPEEERQPQGATLWDHLVKPGWPAADAAELNYFELEKHTAPYSRLRKALNGDLDEEASDAGSGSDVGKDGDVSTLNLSCANSLGTCATAEDFPALFSSALASPTDPAKPPAAPYHEFGACPTYTVDPAVAVPPHTNDELPLAFNKPPPVTSADPVVEYDIVYDSGDGSYVVLDAVMNAYLTLEQAYPPELALELVEVTAEDGNLYTCVAVTQSALAMRASRQEAWLQAQFGDPSEPAPQPQPLPAQAVVPTASELLAQPQAAWGAGSCAAGVAAEAEDDTDISALMQLLCA